MAESSFDLVSKVDRQEVKNALQMAMKEIRTRFDFKGSKAAVEESGDDLVLSAEDEGRLRAARQVLEEKLARRGVSLKALNYGAIEPALGGTVRQVVKIQSGIAADKAKELTKSVKDSKLKVQAQIQGEQVRIVSKSKDELQAAIAFLKQKDFGIDLQFTNYR